MSLVPHRSGSLRCGRFQHRGQRHVQRPKSLFFDFSPGACRQPPSARARARTHTQLLCCSNRNSFATPHPPPSPTPPALCMQTSSSPRKETQRPTAEIKRRSGEKEEGWNAHRVIPVESMCSACTFPPSSSSSSLLLFHPSTTVAVSPM